ncbi:MAG: hypothetical protein ACLFM8_06400 [Halobacteriales archaeon]
MFRWGMYLGALLFVTGATLSFVVLFTQLPGTPSVSVGWFVVGLFMATLGYLGIVVENYLRYQTSWTEPFR